VNGVNEWDFPNTATQPGSAAYYVVRFSPSDRRHGLARWFAWFAHIDAIAAKASDPGAARLKLDWWREEAHMMLQGQARHPLARALSAQITMEQQVAQIRQALQAIEGRILRRQPGTLSDFHQQCSEQYASRLYLLCGKQDKHPGIETLGRHIGISSRLSQLKDDVRDNYLSLPADLVRQFKLGMDELENTHQPEALRELASTLFDSTAPLGPTELQTLASDETLRPAVRFAAQSLRLQHLMEKHRFNPNRKYRLTPIGLLWSAWRMR